MKNCALLLLFLLTNTWAGISQEEVFVHTDRDVYQAGESLKFKVYVLSNNEQNCQVEWLNILLVDQSGDLQFENRIAIKNCMVIGEIVLPGSLVEGSFTLLCYSEGTPMDLAFTKNILIREMLIPSVLINIEFEKKPYRVGEEVAFHINLLSPAADIIKRSSFVYAVKVNGDMVYEGKGKTDKLGQDEVILKYPDTDENGLVSFEVRVDHLGNTFQNGVFIPSLTKPILVNFFPEGGLLVEAFESDIAVTSFDVQGNPIAIGGDLIDQYGEVRGQIETQVSGLGSFSILPDAGIPLRLRITNPSWAQATIDLPKTQANGVVLRLLPQENNDLQLVAINPIEDTYMPLRVEAFLNGNELINNSLLLRTKKTISIKIPEKAKGIIRINVNNEAGEVLAQRCVFIPGTSNQKVAFSSGSISITDQYLSPEWKPGPKLIHSSMLGAELASYPIANQLIDKNGQFDLDLIDTYMLTCIREPSKTDKEDALISFQLRYLKDNFGLSFIDQYISELSIMQFINAHFMSKDSGFSEFFSNNKMELEKLNLIPQKLSSDERIQRQLANGKPVLSIIMGIRAYRLESNQMVFRGGDSFNHQGGSIIVIDGVPKGSNVEELRSLNPFEVASIKVSTSISEIIKYAGMENTAGVVVIETKKATGEGIKESVGFKKLYSPSILWNPTYDSNFSGGVELKLPETKLKSSYWKRVVGAR